MAEPRPSTSLSACLRAFGGRWFIAMSGPLTVPFTAAAHAPESTRVHEVRTQPALYALFGGLFGAPFLLCTFITLAWEPTFWVPSAFVGISLAIILTWFATIRLTLTSDSIRDRSLLSKTDVPLASILAVRFEQGVVPFRDRDCKRKVVVVLTKTLGAAHPTVAISLGGHA